MKYLLITISLLVSLTRTNGQNTSPWPASGNIGIGTTSPGGKALYVRANVSTDHASVIENVSAAGYGVIVSAANDPLRVGTLGNYNGNFLKVASNGNVGINKTNPQSKLDIVADPGFAGLRVSGNNSSFVGPDLTVERASTGSEVGRGSTVQLNDLGASAYNIIQGSSAGLQIFNNYHNWGWMERMRLTDTGYLGIGTSNPEARLEVNGDINVGMNSGSQTGYGARLVMQGADSNGDPLWLSRYNNGSNYSELRLNIGDDVGQSQDMFVVGTHHWNGGAWFPHFAVQASGNVGIGTTNPNQKLTVNGTIYGKEVKVDLSVPGPDYVFEKDYHLPSLESVKTYIDENKHLPEVPSAKEMEANGVNLSEMNMLLLKKIEELTLYQIESARQMKLMRQQIEELEKKNRNK